MSASAAKLCHFFFRKPFHDNSVSKYYKQIKDLEEKIDSNFVTKDAAIHSDCLQTFCSPCKMQIHPQLLPKKNKCKTKKQKST